MRPKRQRDGLGSARDVGALLPHPIAMCLRSSLERRLTVRGEPQEADRRWRRGRSDARRPQRHRLRGISRAGRQDARSSPTTPPREGRLRGATRADQGRHHPDSCMLPGAAGRRRRRAHLRSDRRGSDVRASLPALVAKLGLEHVIHFQDAADRAHLPRDRPLGPHELQRRPTTRHSGGHCRGDSRGRLRCRRLSRAARGSEQGRSADWPERHRDPDRRPRGDCSGDRSARLRS